MVQPLVKGIQSQNVIANAKHFIMNNQVRLLQLKTSSPVELAAPC